MTMAVAVTQYYRNANGMADNSTPLHWQAVRTHQFEYISSALNTA